MSYHTINEEAARRANDMNSFRDYKAGSATAEYRRMVDAATELAEHQKKRVDPMYHEKIDRLLDLYCRKLAENMNAKYAIDARCPSILVSGGSNFPVRKKEKQNVALRANCKILSYNLQKTALKKFPKILLSAVFLQVKINFSYGSHVPRRSNLHQSCAAVSVCIPADRKLCSPRPRKSCPADRKTHVPPSRYTSRQWWRNEFRSAGQALLGSICVLQGYETDDFLSSHMPL